MEARIARLESDVSHLRSDAGEIKLDLRSLRDKLDEFTTQVNGRIDTTATQLAGRIDTFATQLNDRADRQDAKLDALRDDLSRTKLWALMLYFGLAAAILGTMARGFGWL